MESLALVVAILFLSAIFCGPIALGLTYLHVRSKNGERLRRIAVGLFALGGSLTSLQFALAAVPLFPRLIGVAGLVISIIAVKKEFGGPRKLKEH